MTAGSVGHDHLGFLLPRAAVRGRIYIPRYYNVEITDRLAALESTHDLVEIGAMIRRDELRVATGDEIGKMAYGTGSIPFVRTSDISNWEIKTDPKQGVSAEIYGQYAGKQDVRPGDIFLVRDGTYLIGSACMITEADARILFQSHILKLRVTETGAISSPLLLALLTTPIVRRQIRAKQFTADIIDTIGNRYQELVLPVPRSATDRLRFERDVLAVLEHRTRYRELLRKIPMWSEGMLLDLADEVPEHDDDAFELAGNVGFLIARDQLHRTIYVPRYYNPVLDRDLNALSTTHDLVALGDLVADGRVSFNTGIEVGKMAYGTGPVPFIRTSDLSNWELKADPKQSVSEELYEATKDRLDVRPGDIFVVRDGTYLVGTSCIVTEFDRKLLFAGGLYKFRSTDSELDPYLLLALFNTPIVRRQMRSKQFTRDIIDTLGRRIFEVYLPIPKDRARRAAIAAATREAVETRAELRNRARELAVEIEGPGATEEAAEEAEELLTAM